MTNNAQSFDFAQESTTMFESQVEANEIVEIQWPDFLQDIIVFAKSSLRPDYFTNSITSHLHHTLYTMPVTRTLRSSISTSTPYPPPLPPTTATKPVFFWKPHQGHGYLSQWYWSKFTIDNETYSTAEMWMMVQKARCFGDEEIAKLMLETTDPKEHKALGRKVKGFDEKIWNERKCF
jgi:hypothetical protein